MAVTRDGWRVLETSHPPTYYLPRAAFADGACGPPPGQLVRVEGPGVLLRPGVRRRVAPRAAWTYDEPTRGFEPIAGAIAVMAAQVDRCLVDGEVVTPQPGGFYGGWVTSASSARSRGSRARWAGEPAAQEIPAALSSSCSRSWAASSTALCRHSEAR